LSVNYYNTQGKITGLFFAENCVYYIYLVKIGEIDGEFFLYRIPGIPSVPAFAG
jgi:hypothetical protein